MSSEGRDRVLGHADEADGIEEFDNPMPAWWLGLFYLTVILGLTYGVHYHVLASRSQASEYEAELAAAALRWPAASAASLAAQDPAELAAAGAAVYQANCVGCHGVDLKGGIGPDLTDAEWIHGSDHASILKAIEEGVLAKGMPAWGPILGPQKTAEVAAFVAKAGTGG